MFREVIHARRDLSHRRGRRATVSQGLQVRELRRTRGVCGHGLEPGLVLSGRVRMQPAQKRAAVRTQHTESMWPMAWADGGLIDRATPGAGRGKGIL